MIRPITDVPLNYFDTIQLPNCIDFKLELSCLCGRDLRPLSSLLSHMTMPKLADLKISTVSWSFVSCEEFWGTNNNALFSQLTHLDTGKLILPRIYGLPKLTHLSICTAALNYCNPHTQWGEFRLPLFDGLDSLVNLKICVVSHCLGDCPYDVRFMDQCVPAISNKSAFVPPSVQCLTLLCNDKYETHRCESLHMSFPWIDRLEVDTLSVSLTSLCGNFPPPMLLLSRHLEISIRPGNMYATTHCPNVEKLSLIFLNGHTMQQPNIEISGSDSCGVLFTFISLFSDAIKPPTLRHLKMSSEKSLKISCKFLRKMPIFANLEILEVPRFTQIMDNDFSLTIVRF
jgi:hypothetical protein